MSTIHSAALSRVTRNAKSKMENNICHASFHGVNPRRDPPCRVANYSPLSPIELGIFFNTLFVIAAKIYIVATIVLQSIEIQRRSVTNKKRQCFYNLLMLLIIN